VKMRKDKMRKRVRSVKLQSNAIISKLFLAMLVICKLKNFVRFYHLFCDHTLTLPNCEIACYVFGVVKIAIFRPTNFFILNLK
jgi:hypothetical protein